MNRHYLARLTTVNIDGRPCPHHCRLTPDFSSCKAALEAAESFEDPESLRICSWHSGGPEGPPDPQTRKSPGSATNTPEAPQQRKQHGHGITELLGMVVAGLFFSAVMWVSIAGMSGLDAPEVSRELAEVADGR